MLNTLFQELPSASALESVLNFIRGYYHGCGHPYKEAPDKAMLLHTLLSARASLSKLNKPSPFKKVAVFTHHFIFTSPISCDFPVRVYPPEVPRRYYHNAVLAFEISVASLYGAEIGEGAGKKVLSKPIDISKHQHKDIMISFCQIRELKDVYSRLIALLYETLAYEFNEGVRYPRHDPLKVKQHHDNPQQQIQSAE